MAESSDGHVLMSGENFAILRGSSQEEGFITGAENQSQCQTSGELMHNALNHVYGAHDEEFADLLTIQQGSIVSTHNGHMHGMDNTLPLSPQSTQEGVLQQSEIAKLDSELSNTPRELYLHKLLQLTTGSENSLIWYRNVLCSRARALEGCPTGNLINRKTTKKSTSAEKTARDCYILHSYICGDKTNIDEVFDKAKPSETLKVPQIELRSLTQSLLQRVSESEKLITLLKTELSNLSTQVRGMNEEFVKMQSEINSRMLIQESFKKMASDRIKGLDGLDSMADQAWKDKTDKELKRLSQVSLNMQKRISEIQATKSYSSVLASPVILNNSNSGSHTNQKLVDMSAASRLNTHEESIVSVYSTKDQQSIVNMNDMECSNTTVDTNKTDRSFKITRPKTADPKMSTPMNHHVNKNDQKDEGVFIGVRSSRVRNARYYLSGIDSSSNKQGIFEYIEAKGAKISHLILFKPKSSFARLSAKINVRLQDAELLEDDDFWPPGVRCRRWLSIREWDERCSRRNEVHDENWDIGNYDTDTSD